MTNSTRNYLIRVASIRRHGGVTFLDGYSWGDNSTVIHNFKLTRTHTKNYNLKYYVGSILELRAESQGSSTNYSVDNKSKPRLVVAVESYLNPEAFPKTYPRTPIKDKELRVKNPVLAAISCRELRDNLVHGSRIDRALRRYLEEKGFTEYTTPVLEERLGGGAAEPFTTRANYNKKRYYLRSCHEFPGKKLITMGLDKVYIKGPVFRNQDLDLTHVYQFNSVETYETISSVQDPGVSMGRILERIQAAYRHCWYERHGTYIFRDGTDLRNPWPRVKFSELLGDRECTPEVVEAIDKDIKAGVIRLPTLHHMVDLPLSELPLAKAKSSSEAPGSRLAWAVESYVQGIELFTGYIEENEPRKLEERWASGDTKSYINGDFIETLRIGLPPCIGLGIGVDRLIFSILYSPDKGEKATGLREVSPFPLY